MTVLKKLHVMIGIPGSGKTTFRNQLVEQGAVYTNKDEIRREFQANAAKMGKKAFEAFVESEEKARLRKLLTEGHPMVVYDNTNLTEARISNSMNIAKEFGYEVKLEWMMTSMDVATCHKRNTGRTTSKHVPVEVVENMAEMFIGLWFKYNSDHIQVKKNRKSAIIVDLDGTLFHMNGRGAFEWMRVGEDTIDPKVHELLKFYKAQGHQVILCSGRDSVCREVTEKSLADNGVEYDQLFMRKKDDMRKDVYVKLELYMDHIMSDYDVYVCLDDRNQIVRAWRGIGLKCFQVQSGWF